MNNLILQTVRESDLKKILAILKTKNLLLESEKCHICEKQISNIGGFLPKNKKVIPICDDIECTIKASFLVMKHNGNGSPIIEND